MSAPQGFGAAVRAMLAPRRMAAQAVGFAVGIALVAWVVKGAIDAANDPSRAGILESVRAAWESRPWLVAGIALTTALSLVIDGALFWLILLPVRRLGFMEIQWLTFVTATSNFFPVRLGIPVRYAYAMLANRMGFLEATAWFVALTLVILVSLGAVVAATAAVPVPGTRVRGSRWRSRAAPPCGRHPAACTRASPRRGRSSARRRRPVGGRSAARPVWPTWRRSSPAPSRPGTRRTRAAS